MLNIYEVRALELLPKKTYDNNSLNKQKSKMWHFQVNIYLNNTELIGFTTTQLIYLLNNRRTSPDASIQPEVQKMMG